MHSSSQHKAGSSFCPFLEIQLRTSGYFLKYFKGLYYYSSAPFQNIANSPAKFIFFFPFPRNNEKRKEKSRVAARCRRTKEMQIFSELSEALPAKKEEVDQLDKASVMRLAISYLKVRDVVTLREYFPLNVSRTFFYGLWIVIWSVPDMGIREVS